MKINFRVTKTKAFAKLFEHLEEDINKGLKKHGLKGEVKIRLENNVLSTKVTRTK